MNLKVGESTVITVDVTCPYSLETMTICVEETGRTDYNPDDSYVEFMMGYPDLSVELQSTQIGEKTTVYGIIHNEGIASASGRLFFLDGQGRAMQEKSFEALAAGDVLVVSFEFDWSTSDQNRFDMKARLECDDPELYDYNNHDTIHLTFNGHRKVTDPQIMLPANLQVIDSEAFAGAKFSSVFVPEGVVEIGSKAFKDCDRLDQIELPASLTRIAEDAFEGTNGFVIYCPADSVAEAFALAHGFTCITE